jgi:hypothetical protein
MSRIATLGIVGSLDLSSARAEYERFRAEVAQNPIRIAADAAAGGRTFSGQAPPSGNGFSAPSVLTPGANGNGNLNFNPGIFATLSSTITSLNQTVAGLQSAVANLNNAQSGTAQPGLPAGPGGGTSRSGFDNSRFLGLRVGQLGRLATVGFALHEASVLANAYSQLGESYYEARSNPLSQVSAERQFQGAVGTTPIFGGLSLTLAQGLQRMIGGYSKGGLSGFWNATGQGAFEAESDAKQGLSQVTATSARLVLERQFADQGGRFLDEANALNNTDPFGRRIASIRGQRIEFESGLQTERFGREEAIKNEVDPSKKRQLTLDLESWEKSTGRLREQFNRLADAQEKNVRREEEVATLGISLSTTAAQYARAGFGGGAAIARARGGIAKYLPQFDAAGNITGFGNIDESQPEGKRLGDEVRRAYGEAVIEGRAGETRRAGDVQSAINVGRLTRTGRPLDAQIEEIKHEATNARRGVYGQGRLDEIFDLEKEQIADVKRRFSLEGREISTTQGAQTRALMSRLNRDPAEAGQAFLIGAAGLNEATDLANAQRPLAGQRAVNNTVLQLDLLKQTYFDNFRGVQVDPRVMATQGGRQSEDPGSVISAIEKAKQDLIQGFKDAIKDAVDG